MSNVISTRRRYAYFAVPSLLLVILGGAIISVARSAPEQRRQELIEGCHRGNAIRAAIWHNDNLDARSREVGATQFKGDARRSLLDAARQNREDAKALVTAAAEVAIHPGSPKVDCERAFK